MNTVYERALSYDIHISISHLNMALQITQLIISLQADVHSHDVLYSTHLSSDRCFFFLEEFHCFMPPPYYAIVPIRRYCQRKPKVTFSSAGPFVARYGTVVYKLFYWSCSGLFGTCRFETYFLPDGGGPSPEDEFTQRELLSWYTGRSVVLEN